MKINYYIFAVAFIIAQAAFIFTGTYSDANDGGYIVITAGVPFVFAGLVSFLYETVA